MKIAEVMKKFVEPEAVAIVGATRKSGEFSLNIMENIRSYGYTGKLYPVNPNAGEILGVKAYADISEIADPVDLAVIVTPRETVPSVARKSISGRSAQPRIRKGPARSDVVCFPIINWKLVYKLF